MAGVMKCCALLLILSSPLLIHVSSLPHEVKQVSAGGCLAQGTHIPTIAASTVNNLVSRINQIKNGNTNSKKHFQNRERCLPASNYYSEYRLYPSKADANRIVVEEVNTTYYFTKDHYETFYRISILHNDGSFLTANKLHALVAAVAGYTLF